VKQNRKPNILTKENRPGNQAVFFYLCPQIKALGRIVALDYGSKRTGVAVTDPGQMIASPLETVLTHELMNFLQDYFEKEEVELLVVGHPRQMDYSDSESMKQIRFFVQAFKKRFSKIPVEWMDERFTSKMAVDAMITGGMKKSDRKDKGNLDKLSAAIILQSYLEKKTISGDRC
jgi:putative Holliday junction resolvase